MIAGIIYIVVGIVCSFIGILNRKGNISMLHSYHIKNVTEENRIPFGKLIGLGMLIVGFTLILSGVFFILFESMENEMFLLICFTISAFGMVLGFIVMLYALVKYNKGIFA